MKRKSVIVLLTLLAILGAGCTHKSLNINGMICPEGHSEEMVKADFSQCRYYNLDDAQKAAMGQVSVECKECLEKKGYKIQK
ncbi:MAG: hypothetical protein PHW18_04025 [Sulfuricurvum sp.]|uniref:hypothetical protein n=1 Tax=Sulfuricurvum sp. TaxID=2025608 RepID=UPI00262DC057|nr:hypothetical protein [Sulfuricurvum sp.]MDD2828721.1 hypothetical protein [Sulfuricurvum sp.]MDD4949299.1 hypothetical protein [Sulfuricurvum sp.]